MPKRIVIIQGHARTAAGGHFGHALADAYMAGAQQAGGHEVRRIRGRRARPAAAAHQGVGWEAADVCQQAIRSCQHDISWAGHLVIFYPLWLGSMPAMLKGFFEQVFPAQLRVRARRKTAAGRRRSSDRPLGARRRDHGHAGAVLHAGTSAHTALKSLERNILRLLRDRAGPRASGGRDGGIRRARPPRKMAATYARARPARGVTFSLSARLRGERVVRAKRGPGEVGRRCVSLPHPAPLAPKGEEGSVAISSPGSAASRSGRRAAPRWRRRRTGSGGGRSERRARY